MASTNPYTSFTISQAFLGAPLEFHPPLGSPEFQELINAYVTGSASKQDKISQVTLDFYKNATVDLNTGALVRTYVVYSSPWTGHASFEQSPTQSFSSGYSPIYTPSPASSATFGDSTYGSMSMTPPNPMQGGRGRVTKKAKKDTPKTAEARLPGFSIMTKDGIDVTNSAGRGTKTKEQREHAHLMRIMKACDACKKKKIRCDPSHRRSHNDMSRTASTSTQQTSSSSGRLDPSPPASTPSLSHVTTHASQGSLPPFSPSNPIDDFVLFPEDDSSWNSLETQDLGNFNFDINVDLNDPMFDFSFDQQPSGQSSQVGYTPAMTDQFGLGQWAEPQGFEPVSHSRSHPASSTNSSMNTSMNSSMNGSEELNANWQSGWLQAEPLISPRTSTFADNYWAGSVENPQLPQGFIPCDLNHLDAPDWSLFESTIADGSSPDSSGDAMNNQLAEAAQHRRNRKRRAESSEPQTPDIGPIDPSDRQGAERDRPQAVVHSPVCYSGYAREISHLQNAAQLVSKSLRRIKRAPAEYIALGEELQQLEGALTRLQSSQHAHTIFSVSDGMNLQSLRAQLEALCPSGLAHSHSPASRRRNNLRQGMRPDHARELQVTVRHLVRSLHAMINGLDALDSTSLTVDNRSMLTSSPRTQLQVPCGPHHGSTEQALGSTSRDDFYAMILQNTPSDLLPQGIEGSRSFRRIVQSEQDASSRSDSNRLAEPLSSPSSLNAAYEGTSSLNVILEEQTGGFGTSQDTQANSATALPLADRGLGCEDSQTRHGVANPLPAYNRASTQQVPLNNGNVEHSPVTAVTPEPSTFVREELASAVFQTAPTSLLETYHSFAGAIAILGSLALASSITSGIEISAHLLYLIPLLTLSLLVPSHHRTSLLTPALIAGSFLLTSSLTTLGIQSIRTACTDWLGNEPFSAAAKLLLVAALLSSELLSSVNLSVMAVAAVNYLSGTRDACSSGPAVRVSRGQSAEDVHRQGNYASWLGMMDMLSPVLTV